MKKVFSLLFIIGAIVSVAFGSAEGFLVSASGLLLSQKMKPVPGFAFLQIVPGKFIVPEQVPGVNQEVPYMSRAEKALYDQLITLGRSNPVTADLIRQGGISFDPVSYYVRAIITGGAGIQNIVDSSIIKYPGITNFPNGATLSQYYNMCFDRIAVRYAVAASADANAAAITGWSSIRGSMPAALGNGHLVVLSNSNKVLDTPISDFTSVAAITGGGERDYDGGVLEKPRFFLELIGNTVQIQYAQGQTVPSVANNTYAVEVMFYGVQARLKA